MTSAPGRIRDAGADFIRSETGGGAALLVAVAAALIWSNLAPDGYFDFWHTPLSLSLGGLTLSDDYQHWINDALMAVFFFLVGLEIKREIVVGELGDRRKASLPVIAAFGGVLVPALIFVALNAGTDAIDGWAIPMATDIAFAVAILALIGKSIPAGVRLLLLAIAIVDDIIAISVIAIFYTDSLDLIWLLPAVVAIAVMVVMRRAGVWNPLFYVIPGLVVWLGFFESGIHSTIAGVILGLMTPAGAFRGHSVLEDLEYRLHPFSAFLIVPLFALANAGIVIDGTIFGDAVSDSLFWGIAAGLVLGKLVGIGSAIQLARRFGIGEVPEGVTARHIWGVAALGGVGFTVSLFITGLAFSDYDQIEIAKMGIFAGSLIAAALGTLILRWPGSNRN